MNRQQNPSVWLLPPIDVQDFYSKFRAEKGDTMERTIQVTKMRGIKHSEQIHLIELDSDGLHLLHPRLIP